MYKLILAVGIMAAVPTLSLADPTQIDKERFAGGGGGANLSEPGVYLYGELLLLKPFHSEGDAPGFDFEKAYRIVAGINGDDGLGVRVRWFQWDGYNPDSIGGDNEGMEITAFDVELTRTFQIGRLQGVASAGYRYAEYYEYYDYGNPFKYENEFSDSHGIVVGLELSHSLNEYISLFGSARASLQYSSKGLDLGDEVRNIFFSTTEYQLGAEATIWKSDAGGRLFLRAAVEAQGWNGVSDHDSEDVGLIGGAFTIGFKTTM